jgi:hypothetical protein
MATPQFLTDGQQTILAAVSPPSTHRADSRGRPGDYDGRSVMDCVL